MNFKKYLIALLAVFTLLYACRKPSGGNWDVDAVIPVVNSSLNVKNFLGDTLFKTDNTGLLYLTINREVASIKLDSLLNLPDTTIVSSFTLPAPFGPITVAPGVNITQFAPTDIPFNIGNGAQLTKAEVRTCMLTVKFSNFFSQPINLIYKIPNAIKDGQAFTITETIPKGVNTLSKTYDLSGYTLNLRGQLGNKFNTITQTYTMATSSNTDVVTTYTNGEVARLEVSYSEVVPQFVEGYFGQQTIKLPLDTANFGLTKNFTAVNFKLSDATMNFRILNEFGAEFTGSLTGITAINSFDNKAVTLVTNQLDNININRANRVGTSIFPSVKQLAFTKSNSNITSFISSIPDKITYKGSIDINPLGTQVNSYSDFAYYNTGIKILADITIPLQFTADYFLLTSRAAVDFSNIKQFDNIKGGNFVILAANGYPFSAQLQAYMLNEQNQVIDSLLVNGANTIAGGQLSNNIVIAPTNSKVYIPITVEKLANLKKCKLIKIVSKFNVPPSPPDIKLLESYQIDLNIVAEFSYNIGT